MRLRVALTAQDVGAQAAEALAELARQAVSERGTFSVALSGGSTPKLLYQSLRGLNCDWARWQVYFSDERTVGPDSPESNYKLAYDELLAHVPIPREQVFRMKGEADPQEAAREYAAQLPGQLDLILLGMGDDGHTASLFPGTEGLERGGRVTPNFVPKFGTWRLSFTFEEINRGRERWLLVTGGGKAEVLREVQQGVGRYPVEHVQDPLWFLDEAAAAQLER